MNENTRRDFIYNSIMAGGSIAAASLIAAARSAGADTPPDQNEAIDTNPASRNDPGAAHAAWEELVDLLRIADMAFIDRKRGQFDEYEMAYGYRNLTDIVSAAIDMYMLNDADWPVFTRLDTPTKKLLGGSPDIIYQYAPVRGDRRYRITGRKGDDAYWSVTSHKGDRDSGRNQRFDDVINWHKIKTDANGNFEIIASARREGDNWLRISPDAASLLTRNYFLDRNRDRPTTYKIERLDAPATPPRLTREEVAARLRSMIKFIRETLGTEPMVSPTPNTLPTQYRFELGQDIHNWSNLDNIYVQGGFALEPSEALLIEGVVPPCDWWGIQVWNAFLVSPDYLHYKVSINNSQARLGPKGEFRVAIAREDPKIPGLDYVTTAGERQGQFLVRWTVANAPPPRPTCRLVKIADLRA